MMKRSEEEEEEKEETIMEELEQLSLSQQQQQQRDLFGGAIQLSIPTKWRDVSNVRQVPDHQEVYQDCTFACGTKTTNSSIEGTGGCIVVEILQRQDDVNDIDAADYFFMDLAIANGDVVGKIRNEKVWNVGSTSNDQPDGGIMDTTTNLMPRLSKRVKACTCSGLQSIAPLRNNESLEEGKASMVKVELAVVRFEAVETDLLITLSMPVHNNVKTKEEEEGLSSLFLKILQSFEIKDWSLFG